MDSTICSGEKRGWTKVSQPAARVEYRIISSFIVISSDANYKDNFPTGKSLPRCGNMETWCFFGEQSRAGCNRAVHVRRVHTTRVHMWCRCPCRALSSKISPMADCEGENSDQRQKVQDSSTWTCSDEMCWCLWLKQLRGCSLRGGAEGCWQKFNFYQLLLGGTLKFIKQAKLICSSLVSVAWISCQVNRILHFPNYFHICVLPLFVLLQN